jgi:hypothetical protein
VRATFCSHELVVETTPRVASHVVACFAHAAEPRPHSAVQSCAGLMPRALISLVSTVSS